jgi:cysteine-rich repeat protein
MRISAWLLIVAVCAAGGTPARAVETCEGASANYIRAVIGSARSCLTRLAPQGRSCAARNRAPNGKAARVDKWCPAGTVARLACSARLAIIATGLPYDSLSATGFTHLCTSAACGDGVTEPGEQCDDGNVINGDGCSATCEFESNTCSDVCAGVVPVSGTAIKAVRIASGLSSPLLVTAPPRDVSRIFIVEQTGTIRVMKWGTLLPAPFLDIHAKITSGGERGLLGLAFHPSYATNGRFFVDYTDLSGHTVVSQYQVSNDPDVAATTETVLLQVTQPFSNHNGGHLAFGPDGYLYIALGDGGSGGDPQGNGQNINARLGKLLRLDIDGAAPYVSPASNPFFGATPGRDEIWAYGLRNPWRFSFDRTAGDLYIGDVGQDRFEEVDFQPVGSAGGQNYGWNVVEGNGHCYPSGSGCDQTGMTQPILEYDHGQGCSITGGYVYRGCAMPDLRGTYFYGDYCSAFIRSFRVVGGVATQPQDHTAELAPGGGIAINSLSSFGEDARGEIYICDLGGAVFKIVPGT